MSRHAGAPKRKTKSSARRKRESGWDAELVPGPRPGPGMTTANGRQLRKAIARFDPDRPWEEVRDDIRPMLPRLRPLPFTTEEPVRVILPPGILVGFGLDLGPALAQVGPPLLERWAITVDELAAVALGNVRRLASGCDPSLVIRNPVGAMDVAALQTRLGIAAALLLVPDRLARFFGTEPGLLLAPMRDLLLRLPAGTALDDAAWLADEFESVDPNCVHLGAFAWDGRDVRPVALEPVAARA